MVVAAYGDRFARFGRAQPTRYEYLLTLHESNVLALGNENQPIPLCMTIMRVKSGVLPD